MHFANKNGNNSSLSVVDIDITQTQWYQEEQFEHRTQSTLSESLKIFTLFTELKYCSNKVTMSLAGTPHIPQFHSKFHLV